MESEIIDELLDRWELAREEGQPISVEELCREHPDLLPEVQAKVQVLMAMDAKMNDATPQRVAGDGEPPAEPWLERDLDVARDPSGVKGQSLQTTVTTQVFTFFRKGGGGAIYRGEDTLLGRQQAIKVILPQHAVDSEIRRRFENEARVTARLEHPGIIPVYGTGETPDGLPFYTMRFVEDASLDDAILDFHKKFDTLSVATPEFRDLLQRFVSVCQTLAYAHSRGIVHRDIKPHNILLGRYSETLVIDWGLARPFKREGRFKVQSEKTLIIGEEPVSTLSHRSGTLAYMSPQQHAGMLPAPSDDIYSLGATLYKILCGHSPVDSFRDQTESVLREAIVEGRLHPPARPGARIPPALLAICQHAMHVESEQRYRTSKDLADDVSRFIAGDRVRVYREPLLRRTTRWLGQHLRIAQVLAGAALSLMIVWLVVSLFVTNLAVERQRARKANLLSSAQNFSRLLGDELDLRIRILETEARSPDLIRSLQIINTTLQEAGFQQQDLSERPVAILDEWFGSLQRWAIDTGQKYDGTGGQQEVSFNALCVYNNAGYQVARYGTDLVDGPIPASEMANAQAEANRLGDHQGGASTVGRNFRYRGYFHGSAFDQPPETDDLTPHQQSFFISSVYLSTSTDGYNFQITVPVYDPLPGPDGERRILGLLGMPIEIGGLGIPPNGIVINRNPIRLEDDSEVRGLVLHSAFLSERLQQVSEAGLERIAENLDRIQRNRMYGNAQLLDPPVTVGDRPRSGDRLQAVSPIVIHSRLEDGQNESGSSRSLYDTGWFLLTNESPQP